MEGVMARKEEAAMSHRDQQYVVQVSDEERARVMSMLAGTYPFQSDQKQPKKEYPPENTVKYSKRQY
jgi:hypothetical protein